MSAGAGGSRKGGPFRERVLWDDEPEKERKGISECRERRGGFGNRAKTKGQNHGKEISRKSPGGFGEKNRSRTLTKIFYPKPGIDCKRKNNVR
jgi:hypothetical protein